MWVCLHTYVCVPHGFCLLIPFMFFSGACESLDKHTSLLPCLSGSPHAHCAGKSLPESDHQTHLWSSPSPAKQPPSTSYDTCFLTLSFLSLSRSLHLFLSSDVIFSERPSWFLYLFATSFFNEMKTRTLSYVQCASPSTSANTCFLGDLHQIFVK